MLLLLVCLLPALSVGFPDGAPVDACVKERSNTPHHGQLLPQPVHTLPYTVAASGSQYQPGVNITVTIQGVPFRGFFVQARDAVTHSWIGQWEPVDHTKPVPECSAVTHADPRDKLRATLVWTAPKTGPSGHVYFTGSVVKDYATFWSDLIAVAPQ